MKTQVLMAATAALFCFAAPAAATVTFDAGSTNVANVVTAEGYRFTLGGATNGFLSVNSQADIVGNGTFKLFLANNGYYDVTPVAPTSGGFSLSAFDLGGSFIDFPGRWASAVTLTGTLLAGGAVTATFTLPGTATLTTRTLPGTFTGLSSVRFTPIVNANGGPNNYEFVVDNLQLTASAVPEPGAWGLMLIGFGGVGYTLRRKRVSARIRFA